MGHRSNSRRPGTQVPNLRSYWSYDHRSHIIYDPIQEVAPLALVLTSGDIFFTLPNIYTNTKPWITLLVWDDRTITHLFYYFLSQERIPI